MPEEAFKVVFDYVLDVCQAQGLLKGRAIGTDSTLIDANASMDSLHHKELGCSYEDYVLALRRQDMPDAARPLMQIRRQRGEAPFGYFKSFGGLHRMAGHGLVYAVKKALMAALGWNLLLLVKRLM